MEQYVSNFEISSDNLGGLFNHVMAVAREEAKGKAPGYLGVSVVDTMFIENNDGYIQNLQLYDKFSFYCKSVCDTLGFNYIVEKRARYEGHRLVGTDIEEKFSTSSNVIFNTDETVVNSAVAKALKMELFK